MKTSKSCKVTILGNEYSLVSNEPEEHVINSADVVDSIMKEIVNGSKITDGRHVATLAALRLASQVLMLEKEIQKRQKNEQFLIDYLDQEIVA